MERSKKELTIEEAKANFRSAMMEMDPVSVIRKRPIHVLGAAVLAGARGFMQVMPFWIKLVGTSDDNLFHLRTNLRYLDVEGSSKSIVITSAGPGEGKSTTSLGLIEGLGRLVNRVVSDGGA